MIGDAIIVGRHSLIGITSDVGLIAVNGGLIYGGLIIVGWVAIAGDRVRVGIVLGVDLIRVAPRVEIRIIIRVSSPRAIFDFPL